MPPKFIAQQLSHPTGFFAPIIGFLMNRHNAQQNAYAMRCLDLTASEQLLEVGFGGGLTLDPLVSAAKRYVGLDRSAAVVLQAKKRFAIEVKEGRAHFQQGVIEQMPFDVASFDKFLTVNTIYFWSSLEAGLSEIHRVLRPSGRAVIGFLPEEPMKRMKMPADIFTLRDPVEVMQVMTRCGFTDLEIRRPMPSTPWNVITGKRA